MQRVSNAEFINGKYDTGIFNALKMSDVVRQVIMPSIQYIVASFSKNGCCAPFSIIEVFDLINSEKLKYVECVNSVELINHLQFESFQDLFATSFNALIENFVSTKAKKAFRHLEIGRGIYVQRDWTHFMASFHQFNLINLIAMKAI